jgi:hypothetical protein
VDEAHPLAGVLLHDQVDAIHAPGGGRLEQSLGDAQDRYVRQVGSRARHDRDCAVRVDRVHDHLGPVEGLGQAGRPVERDSLERQTEARVGLTALAGLE